MIVFLFGRCGATRLPALGRRVLVGKTRCYLMASLGRVKSTSCTCRVGDKDSRRRVYKVVSDVYVSLGERSSFMGIECRGKRCVVVGGNVAVKQTIVGSGTAASLLGVCFYGWG